MNVPAIILEQLGGRRFIVMTGKQATKQTNEATAIRMLKTMEEIANYSTLSLTAVQNLAKAVSLGTV